ncbi:radical SAM protein [Lutibaculum baratangense]|uniref:Radical SAM domain protein n=1 Tax=Lutibaculum baratangense AMV1 TaxID=631454 RepID=V4RN43_9HYPH|nr:radical SAM protein [Lutibaculum baratangense]ESR24640.1 Radical SAM domain protein [Lutibaculum baratangense AMV1]
MNPATRYERTVLVFGGPYSNLEATRALLDQARRLEIAPDHVICTGDVVAYGADPVATVELIRRSGVRVVRGNCEQSLAAGISDCGCGFSPGSACDRLSAAWFAHADRHLDEDARAWMAGLPSRLDIEIGGRRLAVVHGGTETVNRFIFASTASREKQRELALAGTDGLIGGHCGIPFTQIVGGRLWHNAGAIGLPAHDGTTRSWYSLLTPEGDGIRIEHRALEYDHASAARAMRDAGLPEGYAAALETGIWPSCDVLPAREIAQAGRPLVPGQAFWPHSAELAPSRRREPAVDHLWPAFPKAEAERHKFRDPDFTADGHPRGRVGLRQLETLWFNTGTLCNLTCRNCYIESSPRNDRLVYLTRAEVAGYLDEIERNRLGTSEIGFTGGEPFLNPEMIGMLDDVLSRGFRALVLTNAMRPMMRHGKALLALRERHGGRLAMRVSLDHFSARRHEEERGPRTYRPTLDGLVWLARNGFELSVAGRTMWGEDLDEERDGYARLFEEHGIQVDAHDGARLILFPEMDPDAEVPEITTGCWSILGKNPEDMMCASSRMVVKRKGAERPSVVACTLLPYEPAFELGTTLEEASGSVALNHRHCAKFCVLGGASCSAGDRATKPAVGKNGVAATPDPAEALV